MAERAPLTILRAPSGFGKTVAVAQWLADVAGPDGPALWVRADPAGGPQALWTDIAELMSEAGIAVSASGDITYRVVEAAARRHGGPITIVVDDFDDSSDSAVEAGLVDLVRYCPDMRLVVCLHSSRHFPNSLRGEIETTVIESPELAFTVEEIAAVGSHDAPLLTSKKVERIRECTGGWPEPTRFVLLALHDDPEQSIDQAALTVAREYLAEAVLPRFSHRAWMHFALTASLPEILTETTAELASSDAAATRRLERMESAGILTATIRRGLRVYRWPDAARAALQEEFDRRDPAAVRMIHSQLAEHHLRQDEWAPALAHALRAGDTPLLVRLVELSWGSLIHEDPSALDEALAAIPTDEILRNPVTTAARDVRMHILGDVSDNSLLSLPDPLPADHHQLARLARSASASRALRIATALTIAMRMRGLAAPALDFAGRTEIVGMSAGRSWPRDVLPMLPRTILNVAITRLIFDELAQAEQGLLWAYNTARRDTRGYVRRDSAGKLALLKGLQGETSQAELWLDRHRRARATVGALTPTIDRSGMFAQTLIAIERLDRDGVARLMPLVEQRPVEEENWLPFASYLHGRQSLLWGDRQGALARLDGDADRLARWMDAGSTMAPLVTAIRADLLLSLGQGGLARALLEHSAPHPALQPPLARLALLTGDHDTALRIATSTDASHTAHARAELLLVGAVALLRQGNGHGAAERLYQALQISQDTGAVRPFAMVPRDDLCRIAGAVPAARQLLEAEPLRSTPSPFQTRVTIIELTDRERRVLDRIAGGHTVQQMARDSFVSANTIKTQVRSLYAKLGANSRATALVRAAQHGLLPASSATAK